MRITQVAGAALLAALTATLAYAGEPAHHRTAPAAQDPAAYAADASAQARESLSGVPVADRADVISWKLVTNGPVPDTAANRARYEPLSHAGRATRPAGN
jgi:hypothetical protein